MTPEVCCLLLDRGQHCHSAPAQLCMHQAVIHLVFLHLLTMDSITFSHADPGLLRPRFMVDTGSRQFNIYHY